MINKKSPLVTLVHKLPGVVLQGLMCRSFGMRSSALLIAMFLSACAHEPGTNTSPTVKAREELPSAGRPQIRISDGVIKADQRFISDLEKRLADLNAAGVPARNYHLSKAVAWLDFATEEYSDNDRGGVVEEALAQSVRLIRGLESKSKSLPMETEIIKGSRRIRDDLWSRAIGLKQHAEFACVADRIARLEVQLVWAGHEDIEGGWRHAKPYIEIAEDLANQIEWSLESCPKPPARSAEVRVEKLADDKKADDMQADGKEATQKRSSEKSTSRSGSLALAPAGPANAPTRITLAADTLFRFNGAAQADIQAAALQQLEALILQLKGMGEVHQILITGHSDRLGDAAYNLKLSQVRANTLRELFVDRGFNSERVQAAGAGESEPLVTCTGDRAQPVLIDCLQANRRVEIRIFATPAPASSPIR